MLSIRNKYYALQSENDLNFVVIIINTCGESGIRTPVRQRRKRFSRPPHSTTLPTLRIIVSNTITPIRSYFNKLLCPSLQETQKYCN